MQPSSLGGARCLEGEGVETAGTGAAGGGGGGGGGRGGAGAPSSLGDAPSVGVKGGDREEEEANPPPPLLLLPLNAPESTGGGERPR